MKQQNIEKQPKASISLRRAWGIVFSRHQLINRAYFFVIIPFLLVVLSLIVDFVANSGLVVLIPILVIIVLSFVYQLYLWGTSFFYSQQISENDWNDYELILQELTADFAVKIRILVIKIIYLFLPLLLASIAAIFLLGIQVQDLSLAVLMAEANTETLALVQKLSIFIIFSTIVSYTLDNTLVQAAQYLYARHNSLIIALNPLKVFKLVVRKPLSYLVVVLLAMLPNALLVTLSIPLSVILLVPILGALLGGLLIGIGTMFSVLFIANLHGQIWRMYIDEEN